MNRFIQIRHSGIFLYSYLNSMERLSENNLLEDEDFYILRDENISTEYYKRTKDISQLC